MARMVRKQIYIPKRQDSLLKRLARERRVSEAELIRQAIEHDLHTSMPRPFHRDPDAWEKVYRFMLSRQARATVGAQPYRWRREDAYADRLSRYDRK